MLKILVVDDDVTTRLIFKKTLQSEGYEVVLANNGAEGLQQATTQNPDLIICDWIMPEMDGVEVCDRLKSHPKLASAYFILLSACEKEDDLHRELKSKADGFLSKPVAPNDLKVRVREALRSPIRSMVASPI